MFFKNPDNDTTLYSGHFQQLKRSRSQDKFRLAAFMVKIYHMVEKIRGFFYGENILYGRQNSWLLLW